MSLVDYSAYKVSDSDPISFYIFLDVFLRGSLDDLLVINTAVKKISTVSVEHWTLFIFTSFLYVASFSYCLICFSVHSTLISRSLPVLDGCLQYAAQWYWCTDQLHLYRGLYILPDTFHRGSWDYTQKLQSVYETLNFVKELTWLKYLSDQDTKLR